MIGTATSRSQFLSSSTWGPFEFDYTENVCILDIILKSLGIAQAPMPQFPSHTLKLLYMLCSTLLPINIDGSLKMK
jgi:hypothetical protein